MEELRSLEDLLDLQAEDLEIDRLLHQRETLPELAEYRSVHQLSVSLDARLEDAGGRRREVDLAIDKAEGDVKIDEEKLNREEQRLYAGGLSARDAEHLRAEVEMLRRQISQREDEILASIEVKEQVEGELAGLQAERDVAGSDKDRLDGLIRAAWAKIDAEIARHETKKQDVLPLIDPEMIELYDELRPIKEGVAVGRLADGICGGCHLRLSAAEQVTALREAPPRCYHCRRILVAQ